MRAGQRISVFNAVAGGVTLGGIGVWAMHFIGMLALQLPTLVSISAFTMAGLILMDQLFQRTSAREQRPARPA